MRIIRALLFACLFAGPLFSQGSVLLVGGGSENYNDWSDKPYKWLVEHAPNRKILVLHYADTTTWFSGYFPSLSPCTVSNMFISSAAQANDSATYRHILKHDGIFLRGGDQSLYVSRWKGTLTQKAIKEVFARGGVIGGSSAGEMVLGQVAYTAGNSDNGALLRNPSASITLETDFLPFVQKALAESHTSERGRIGRTPVFLARYKELNGIEITGIAVDANTALAIGGDGIGEVMGASAVALLRWSPATQYRLEAGKPFSLRDMKMDQLLPGYKINLLTNEITVPSSAQPFTPKAFAFPRGTVILDGSGNYNDWAVSTGSLKKLQSFLAAAADTIGIITSPKSSTTANQIVSLFLSWGGSARVIYIDNARKNDPATADAASRCGAFVFAGNTVDSIGGLLDTSFAVGRAFATKAAEGKPVACLGEDVMAAGEKVILGLYSSMYSAYYGTLSLASGLNIIKGIQFVPRLYQNQNNSSGYDYSENRVMGMMWSMGKSQLPYGMLLDAGACAIFTPTAVEAGGISAFPTPLLLLDFSAGTLMDFPVFRRPGRVTPLQNVALIGAKLNFLRAGDSYTITNTNDETAQTPGSFLLLQNFPNPFNPSTRIRYSVGNGGYATVNLKVYNPLGGEVAALVNQTQQPGSYETEFNASGLASGLYFARLTLSDGSRTITRTHKMICIK